MIKHFLTFIFLAFTVQANAASNAGTAVFQSKEGGANSTTRFEYLDESTSRMDVEGQKNGDAYMLFKGGKALVVTHTQGQTIVMDMAQLSSMASSFGVATDQSTKGFTSSIDSMKATGKKETVAGIQGEVYQLEWLENGEKRQDELVLSKDKKARAYTRAWMNAIRMMQKAGAQQEIKGDHLVARLDKKKLGILRLGDRFELKSIKSSSPDVARFEVPESTMEMPNLGSLFGGQSGNAAASGAAAAAGAATAGGEAAAQTESSGGLWGSMKNKFKNKGDRQANRQASRTDRAVDRATDEATDQAVGAAVGKSVDKIFGKIFK